MDYIGNIKRIAIHKNMLFVYGTLLFVYRTLLLNLVVGLQQFFVVNIQIGTQISTNYIS